METSQPPHTLGLKSRNTEEYKTTPFFFVAKDVEGASIPLKTQKKVTQKALKSKKSPRSINLIVSLHHPSTTT